MPSLKSIYEALSSANAKKENLRKAFEKVQSHSSSYASLTLQWKDLEELFDSSLKSLDERLKYLEAKEKQAGNDLSQKESSSEIEKPEELQGTSRPELKSLCINMDGKGLQSYLIDLCAHTIAQRQDLASVRAEVGIFLQSAPDPAKLVLDAMQGFYPLNSGSIKEGEVDPLRRTCILLLNQLALISPQIEPQVKEEARKLAVNWRGKLSGENKLEIVAFFKLLRLYNLVSSFSIDELLDLVAEFASRHHKQSDFLFRALDMPDKAPDLIQKLAFKGNQLDAVYFVYAFDLVDKFPPVPLLKQYVTECKKAAEEACRKQNNSLNAQHNAMDKELSGLRGIIKCIKEHNLQSQFPPESLDKRIEQLEKQKAVMKHHSAALGNKRPRPNEPAPPQSVAAATLVPPLPQSPLYQPGLISDRVNPYLTSSSGLYGLGGQTPSYGSSSILGSISMGYGGNLSPSRSHLYSSGLYDRPRSYEGSALLPHYRSSYYP